MNRPGWRKALAVNVLALAAAVAAGPAAHAQAPFPNKPVRLIISFTPGSATDIVGRIVAQKLSAGVPGFEYDLWVGLWGPAGIPADVAARINKDVQAALASPDVKERLRKLGAEPMTMTIPEFTQFVQREIADSQRIIQAAGLKPQ